MTALSHLSLLYVSDTSIAHPAYFYFFTIIITRLSRESYRKAWDEKVYWGDEQVDALKLQSATVAFYNGLLYSCANITFYNISALSGIKHIIAMLLTYFTVLVLHV